jgi:hypothetical protein
LALRPPDGARAQLLASWEAAGAFETGDCPFRKAGKPQKLGLTDQALGWFGLRKHPVAVLQKTRLKLAQLYRMPEFAFKQFCF